MSHCDFRYHHCYDDISKVKYNKLRFSKFFLRVSIFDTSILCSLLISCSAVFNYNSSNHNVFKVNGTAFQNCEVPPPNEALTTGSDTIPLKTSGKKWYICGKPKHCSEKGMKLVINVQEALEVPSPSPMPNAGPPSSANGILASGYQAFAAAIAAIALLVIV